MGSVRAGQPLRSRQRGNNGTSSSAAPALTVVHKRVAGATSLHDHRTTKSRACVICFNTRTSSAPAATTCSSCSREPRTLSNLPSGAPRLSSGSSTRAMKPWPLRNLGRKGAAVLTRVSTSISCKNWIPLLHREPRGSDLDLLVSTLHHPRLIERAPMTPWHYAGNHSWSGVTATVEGGGARRQNTW